MIILTSAKKTDRFFKKPIGHFLPTIYWGRHEDHNNTNNNMNANDGEENDGESAGAKRPFEALSALKGGGRRNIV